MADPQLLLQIVAVHGGAGFHHTSSDSEVKHALRLACTRAIAAAVRGDAALQVVQDAISILEDEECLNAGYGSNLTVEGNVECDASLMDGPTGDFGAIGAVSGVRYPIKLAYEVLQYSREPDPLGRTPPLLLVSSGAQQFSKMRGLECSPESLISPHARRDWTRWKSELETAQVRQSQVPSSDTSISISVPGPISQVDGCELHDRQDTVGAVVYDAAGDLAAGVSSGGLLLKLPGRVGEAAIYGSGCWATQDVACSVSGAGEHITRMSLARTICDAVAAAGDDEDIHDILQHILGRDFLATCSEEGEPSPQAGLLLLVKERDSSGRCKPALEFGTARLWCAFTTDSMAVGFASTLNPKPRATILRRPPRTLGSNSSSLYITALSVRSS